MGIKMQMIVIYKIEGDSIELSSISNKTVF